MYICTYIWASHVALKKEFIGPGLHLRPVCADYVWPPLQWTLSSGRLAPLEEFSLSKPGFFALAGSERQQGTERSGEEEPTQ